eukprot:853594-Ditylum_brightwellii.AAC.1
MDYTGDDEFSNNDSSKMDVDSYNSNNYNNIKGRKKLPLLHDNRQEADAGLLSCIPAMCRSTN